jgi:GntR family transcriptional regulator, gluconate operon transcriptional repressor
MCSWDENCGLGREYHGPDEAPFVAGRLSTIALPAGRARTSRGDAARRMARQPAIQPAARDGADQRDLGDDLDFPVFAPLVAPRKLAEDASALIREQILTGGLRRGTHLVEAKIAGRLGISRGTVREAFKVLAAEGLIQEEPRRGAFVVILSRTDVREIYDVRTAIEGRAAWLIARRGEASDLTALDAAIDEIRSAARAGDIQAVRRADLAFHERLTRLSGNGRLHDIFVRSVPALQTLIDYDELPYSSLDGVTAQHEELVTAIRSGDPDLAARALERHVDDARDKVAAYFEEQSTD